MPDPVGWEVLIQLIAKPIAEAVLEELRPQFEVIVRRHAGVQKNSDDKLIRIDSVLAIVGIKKTAWFSGIKAGRYPQPIKLGRASLWRLSEVMVLVGINPITPVKEAS